MKQIIFNLGKKAVRFCLAHFQLSLNYTFDCYIMNFHGNFVNCTIQKDHSSNVYKTSSLHSHVIVWCFHYYVPFVCGLLCCLMFSSKM